MLKDEYIIYLSNIYWHETWFSKQSLAYELSKNNKVLFVNSPISLLTKYKDKQRYKLKNKPLIKISNELTIFTPHYLLPYHRLKITVSHAENLLLSKISPIMKNAGGKEPIIIINSPEHYEILGKLKEKVSLYHCTDNYAALPEVNQKLFLKLESKLLQKVDLVLAVSQELYDLKKQANKNTFFFPNAVQIDNFDHLDSLEEPSPLVKLPRPRFVFLGSINDRLDFKLIDLISKSFPEAALLFIGPKGKRLFTKSYYEDLKKQPNVYMTGNIPHREIPAYLKFSDVCIIPYVRSKFNLASDPLKVYEYLAAGKPTVVTHLPAFDKLKSVCYIASDHEEFIDKMSEAITEDSDKKISQRKEIARENSWEKRSEELADIVSNFLKK